MEKKRRGRPAKGPSARVISAGTKLTLEERERLQAAAQRMRRTESDLLREWILGRLHELG
jgi:predicted DNA-binding protein